MAASKQGLHDTTCCGNGSWGIGKLPPGTAPRRSTRASTASGAAICGANASTGQSNATVTPGKAGRRMKQGLGSALGMASEARQSTTSQCAHRGRVARGRRKAIWQSARLPAVWRQPTCLSDMGTCAAAVRMPDRAAAAIHVCIVLADTPARANGTQARRASTRRGRVARRGVRCAAGAHQWQRSRTWAKKNAPIV